MTGLVGRVLAATLAADAGGAIGASIGKVEKNRLVLMMWIAAGALLAVTGCDILPEAQAVLSVSVLALALASGFVLLWLISRYVFVACPACASASLDHQALHLGRNVMLLTVALAIHSFLDGLGVAASEGLRHGADYGLVIGLSIHKLPEGLALALLLVGSGINPFRSLLITAVVESATALGGFVGASAATKAPSTWIAFAAAHVAGGFLFLVATSVLSALASREKSSGWKAGAIAFVLTSLCVFGVDRFFST